MHHITSKAHILYIYYICIYSYIHTYIHTHTLFILSAVDLVFNAFEKEESGTISFMEYITMLSVCRRGDPREKLILVFRIYGASSTFGFLFCSLMCPIQAYIHIYTYTHYCTHCMHAFIHTLMLAFTLTNSLILTSFAVPLSAILLFHFSIASHIHIRYGRRWLPQSRRNIHSGKVHLQSHLIQSSAHSLSEFPRLLTHTHTHTLSLSLSLSFSLSFSLLFLSYYCTSNAPICTATNNT